MPYIKAERRWILHPGLVEVKTSMEQLHSQDERIVAGDLNYIVFSLAKEYIDIVGMSYNNISDAIKALTGAAHELERRVLDPYEDKAIGKNGDV